MFIEVSANKKSTSHRKPVLGVGINDAGYNVAIRINGKQFICPFYRKWKSMLERCYSARFHKKHPTYIGCSVCDEWLMFSNFKLWMLNQDWKGNHLDKDILHQGNKVYSPQSCLFVDAKINSLLLDSKSARGLYPQGVCSLSNSNKFMAYVATNGKRSYLGLFETQEEAHDTYKAEKYKIISKVALNQSEPLKSALLNYIIN